jgi:hypothetical protein
MLFEIGEVLLQRPYYDRMRKNVSTPIKRTRSGTTARKRLTCLPEI